MQTGPERLRRCTMEKKNKKSKTCARNPHTTWKTTKTTTSPSWKSRSCIGKSGCVDLKKSVRTSRNPCGPQEIRVETVESVWNRCGNSGIRFGWCGIGVETVETVWNSNGPRRNPIWLVWNRCGNSGNRVEINKVTPNRDFSSERHAWEGTSAPPPEFLLRQIWKAQEK